MPLSSEGPSRSFRQNVALAVPLAWVAGAVNAAGFFRLGTHTSHLTGQAAALGEAVAGGAWAAASSAAGLLVAFVFGALVSEALLHLRSGAARGRYTPALLLEAAVLGAIALSAASASLLTQALCFAMGLQNAMVTRISSAVVRTTHLTGVLTDLGMELFHLVRRAVTPGGVTSPRAAEAARVQRAGLHLALVVSFVVGALSGSLLVLRWDDLGFATPAAVLLVLVAADWRRG